MHGAASSMALRLKPASMLQAGTMLMRQLQACRTWIVQVPVTSARLPPALMSSQLGLAGRGRTVSSSCNCSSAGASSCSSSDLLSFQTHLLQQVHLL